MNPTPSNPPEAPSADALRIALASEPKFEPIPLTPPAPEGVILQASVSAQDISLTHDMSADFDQVRSAMLRLKSHIEDRLQNADKCPFAKAAPEGTEGEMPGMHAINCAIHTMRATCNCFRARLSPWPTQPVAQDDTPDVNAHAFNLKIEWEYNRDGGDNVQYIQAAGGDYVDANFARSLERSRNALREELRAKPHVERCEACNVLVSDWVEAEHFNGRICRPCEHVHSLAQQVETLKNDLELASKDIKNIESQLQSEINYQGSRL